MEKKNLGFIAPAMLSNDSSLQDPFFLGDALQIFRLDFLSPILICTFTIAALLKKKKASLSPLRKILSKHPGGTIEATLCE